VTDPGLFELGNQYYFGVHVAVLDAGQLTAHRELSFRGAWSEADGPSPHQGRQNSPICRQPSQILGDAPIEWQLRHAL